MNPLGTLLPCKGPGASPWTPDPLDLGDFRMKRIFLLTPVWGPGGRAHGPIGRAPSPSDPPGSGAWGHPPLGVWGLRPQEKKTIPNPG
jgi:hypothetical protein